MTTHFKNSLQALEKSSPLLRMQLLLQSSNDTPNRDESLNYPIKLAKKLFFIESSQLEDINPTLKKKPSSLFIYGVGLGKLFRFLQKWLEKDPTYRLFFFEDRLDVLKALFSTPSGLEMAKHPQVALFYLRTPHFWSQNENTFAPYLNGSFEIIAQKSYQKNRPYSWKKFKQTLSDLTAKLHLMLGEYYQDAPLLYQNFLKNLPKIPDAIFAHDLFDKFKQIPAVICAAGPSLNRDQKELQQLQDKALIFAGGRALAALNNLQVQPHIAVGIDPYPMHCDTFSLNNFFQLPLLFRARMNSDAVDRAQGPLIYVSKAAGHPLVDWFEKKLNLISPEIDEGNNVINFSIQLASHLGCNPIILVGSDLAYHNKQPYSSSLVVHQDLPKEGNLNQNTSLAHRPFIKKDAKGGKIFTLWKWIQEAEWIDHFAKKHPECDLYNATMQGLNIPSLNNKPLKWIKNNLLTQNFDLEGRLHQALISQEKPKHVAPKVTQTFAKLEKSLLKCLQFIQDNSEFSRYQLQNEAAYHAILCKPDQLIDQLLKESCPEKRREEKRSLLQPLIEFYIKQMKMQSL